MKNSIVDSVSLKENLSDSISKTLEEIESSSELSNFYSRGKMAFLNGDGLILSYSGVLFEVLIHTTNKVIVLKTDDDRIIPYKKEKQLDWDSDSIAALLILNSEITKLDRFQITEHKKYSREGMIHRVTEERKHKALKEKYRIVFSDNLYGDHTIYTDKGQKYKVFLRDFEQETGYSDSLDAQINKLGTSKHIMAVFNALKTDKKLYDSLDKSLPFVEIYLDPLNNYRISRHSDSSIQDDLIQLLDNYFGNRNFIKEEQVKDFLPFIEQAAKYDQIVIRPEVLAKVDKIYTQDMLGWLKNQYSIPYNEIKANLYPYQKHAVEFFTFKEGGILADEMGLGKTLQAISIAVAKKSILGFKKVLIVCPASLKDQWKKEIEKFSNETAWVINGNPNERADQYHRTEDYFTIVNYESVLRDSAVINSVGIDFLILDEAQRFKNFETKTSSSIKILQKKHVLVLTGTPIENRISDLFSLMQVVDEQFLGPLWEFSYKYCLFDHYKTNKINGYYNLKELNKKLSPVLLRREKRKVIEQLPNVNELNISLKLSREQQEFHASYARGVSKILRKKFLTPVDQTRLYQLLAAMRMVCNSTYLVDPESNESTKLIELEHILIEKIDILNTQKKIIIFSEWLKSHKLIGEILRKYNLTYIEFNGKVPVSQRGKLIKKFEEDPSCKFFLSTESGGAGLNLQVADTLINFELPWNPAKKNQRIGRIDRLGQKNQHLTVINLITINSIETKIASGLQLKQNLFDGVLSESNELNYVDFSEKGKSQFLDDLRKIVDEFEIAQEEKEAFTDEEGTEHEELSSLTETFTEDQNKEVIENLEQENLILKESQTKDSHQGLEDKESSNQTRESSPNHEQLEEVLSQGMGFFAGLYKMATGEDMGANDQQMTVNKETGEVIMKFKLPGFPK